MAEIIETPTLSQDLRVGDVVLHATLGGSWTEPLDAVRIYPDAIDAWIGVERLHFLRDEMLTVRRVVEERPRLATVHPIMAGILSAHGVTR